MKEEVTAMTGVVAVVGPTSPSLTEAAGAIARLLRAGLRQVPATKSLQSADAVRRVLNELARPDVLVAVMSGCAATEAMTRDVISSSPKPVVVIPSSAATRPLVSRVLLPLDGSLDAAAAVAATAQRLADADVDLIVLHVFDDVTVPRFWDQAAHARDCWEREFRARYCPHPRARLHLRTGAPAEQVLAVAEQEQVHLIVLGWSQRLDPERAVTVRRLVDRAQVPVMLMPVPASPRSLLRRGADELWTRPVTVPRVSGPDVLAVPLLH
jgi:hypothetical protein